MFHRFPGIPIRNLSLLFYIEHSLDLPVVQPVSSEIFFIENSFPEDHSKALVLFKNRFRNPCFLAVI